MNNKKEEEIVAGASTTTTETVNEEKELLLNPFLFLAFAEYLGYVSPFIDWVMSICEGKDIPTYQKKILNVDAIIIYHRMLEEVDIKEIKGLYSTYHELILGGYEENMKPIVDNDSLPF